MIVMKFGGSSVQNEEAIGRVISIVKTRLREKPVVVVSALAKVTRALLEIAEEAENQNAQRVEEVMLQLRERHFNLCRVLLEGELLEKTMERIEELFSSLETFTDGVCQIGELSPRSRARILSTGELLSSTIIAAAMNANGIICHWADARKMIVTDSNYMSARPDLVKTEAYVRREIGEAAKGADLVLTQGFVAATESGTTTVLGFEGSDFTAAILGMSLVAERVEIWTDVDGIRTADPRVVAATCKIDRVSYDEAAEMAYLGARVLHPLTMGPARKRNIPIRVLNTMNPDGDGSWVSSDSGIPDGAKSVAFLTEIDYVEISTVKLGSVASILGKVFSELNRYEVEVCLVSCSQSKISLTFEPGQAGFRDAIEEIAKDYELTLYRDKSQISVVGKNVSCCEGMMDSILAAGKVYMVTDGSDLKSVSAVVDRSEVRNIVNRLHKDLFA